MAEGARTERLSPWRTPADTLLTRRWRSLLSTLVVTTAFSSVQVLTGAVSFLILAAGAAFVLLLRIFLALRLSNLIGVPLAQEDMRRIESEHVVGAGLTTTLASIGAATAMLAPLDTVCVFICLAVVGALLAQLASRGHGAPSGVGRPLLVLCAPMIIASLVRGEPSVIAVSILLGLVAFDVRSASRSIRNELSGRFRETERLSKLVEKFDIALDTMPHGLILLDAERRVKIANLKARELFDVSGPGGLAGLAIGAPVPDSVARAALGENRYFLRRICEFADSSLEPVQITLPGDVHMELSGARRIDGSAVIVFEDISASVRAEEKLLHMAKFDALTGLSNRHFFAEQFRQKLDCLPPSAVVGFLLIDIDDLKSVNDARGHAFGDRALFEIGRRFMALSGPETLVARMMSDQFGVFFFSQTCKPDDLKGRIRQFHAGLQGAFSVYDVELNLSFSGGYVLLENRPELISHWQMKADLALSEAKERARGLCVGYQREMDDRYTATRRLRDDLRAAIAADSLSVVFQPMYRPDGSAIQCCEALARWTHPERGPIGPDVFIRMAEEMGLVSSITRFVLEAACRECAGWPEPISVSVNLSAHDLKNSRIVDVVSETLARAGLAAKRLHLEVTESSLMDDPHAAAALLGTLRAMGVTIAIDDFGTGFSSISYLDSLPLDVVKIDRSFVRNVTEDGRRLKLLKGTVHLARSLGLGVVVEGVETPEQLQVLIENDCADLVQGYVFSRPLSRDAVLDLMQK